MSTDIKCCRGEKKQKKKRKRSKRKKDGFKKNLIIPES